MYGLWNKGIKYLIPFFIGCVLFILFQKKMLTDYGMLSEQRLLRMMVCDWSGHIYLFYLVERRFPLFLVLYLLVRENDYFVLIKAGILFYQFVMGFLFAECFVRYGMDGIVFALTIGFPHMIFYLFGLLLLKKRRVQQRKILYFLVYIFVITVGLILEIYCNPWLLKCLIEKIIEVS